MQTLETVHLLPTPDLAGWTETERATQAEATAAEFRRRGANVSVERIRNTAFDKPGQMTTFRFTVRYPEPAPGPEGA
jgi:hypothetical protein